MKVVNLYGGPGTGKSTTAALVFGLLKTQGYNAELVTEFAKDMVWENRRAIECQPYMFGKQLWRVERLRNQVDIVVTDSPLLLSTVYGGPLGRHWIEFVKEQNDAFDNLNIFLIRNNDVHPYSPKGRYQETVDEASELDVIIRENLVSYGEDFFDVKIGDAEYVYEIVEMAIAHYGRGKNGKKE